MGNLHDTEAGIADQTDAVSKILDVAGGLGVDGLGPATSLLALPGDAMKLSDSMDEMKSDRGTGIYDFATNALGTMGDLAGMAGDSGEGAGRVLTGGKGALELGKGGNELYEGIKEGDADKDVAAVNDLLNGLADGSQAAPNEDVRLVGKSLGAGMAIGNAIAPTIFGEKNKDDSVQTPDGQWHGSTGNSAIDWMAGAGKYSNSRWGDTAEEKQAVDDKYDTTKADFYTQYTQLQVQAATHPDDPDLQDKLQHMQFVAKFAGG